MTALEFIGIIILSEVVFGFIFSVIAQVFYKKIGINFGALFKGLVERAYLFASLVNDYPHALTLFGALKVATRLKRTSDGKDDDEAFNSFYLLGNFISVMMAISYVYFYKLNFCYR
jgi:hypothetical protein